MAKAGFLRRQALLPGVLAALVAIGLHQMGQGMWIYLKADLAQFLLQRAWTKTRNGETRVNPWPWADTWPVARLLAPKHGVSHIVLAGANGRTLAFGPAYVSGSALPGRTGTTVLTGHRDTHFRFLSRLGLGDELLLEDAGLRSFRYRVDDIQIVDSRMGQVLDHPDEATLVLVTCYPFDAITSGGALRYVVIATAGS